ncbi:capsid protein [uncultured Tateyamaria sp.]|uniref:capsid protein n=1 Tax=uncultured Tateyamaria sp. TaxID=455651 RepID=UPI0026047C75|nr:capsid protein [uncultured Tateyamaria sp.]
MSYKRPFNVDATLSAVAIAYKNGAANRIADEVMPRVPVGSETFKWHEYPLAEAFQVPEAEVGRRGRVRQMEFSSEEKESSVKDWGLESPIPHSDISEAERQRAAKLSMHNPETHAVEMLQETIGNIREVRVANIIHNPDTYDATRREVLAGGDQLTDYVNSDPINVIGDAMNGTLIYRPNMMVISRYGWSKLSKHPKLVNAVRGGGTTDGIITPEQFLDLFAGEGLQNIQIGEAYYNSAKPGQDPSLQRAWGNHIALIHQNRQATTQPGMVTFGYTAELGAKIAGRIIDEDVGLEGGVRIRTGERVRELVVAKDAGYFIQNAFAAQ